MDFKINLLKNKINASGSTLFNSELKKEQNSRKQLIEEWQKVKKNNINQFENQMHKQIFMNNKHKIDNIRKSLETSIFKDVDLLERDQVNENI